MPSEGGAHTMILILCLFAAALLLLFLAAPGRAGQEKTAPFRGRYFAHRGLHTRDGAVPENSLAAFRRAAEAGWGVELDVRLTADGRVVVFHDDTLDRVCGVSGRVDSFTYDQLQAFPLRGTAERIPLFSDVLTLLAGKVPVIVELKTGPRNRELCEKTLALMREWGGELCMESFDPTIVAWFRRHAPEFFRGQLATAPADYRKGGQPAPAAFLLSATLLNFLGRPQFIAYRIGPRPWTTRLAEALGAVKIGWVARKPSDEAGLEAVIFEFYEPKRQKQLL